MMKGQMVSRRWRTKSQGQAPGAIFKPGLTVLLGLTALALTILFVNRLPPILQEVSRADLLASLSPSPIRTDGQVRDIEPAAGPSFTHETTSSAGRYADGPMSVAAIEALALELSRREAGLDQRERSIMVREAAVTVVEQRLRDQLAEIDSLKSEAAGLIKQIAEEDRARIAQLSKVYEAMKPKNAAAIFEQMSLKLLLPIIEGMREVKVSAIVAAMSPDKARQLTAELSRKRELKAPQ
jgi:flagellar motility protein MotE (MotC chaperone)